MQRGDGVKEGEAKTMDSKRGGRGTKKWRRKARTQQYMQYACMVTLVYNKKVLKDRGLEFCRHPEYSMFRLVLMISALCFSLWLSVAAQEVQKKSWSGST